mgnify:CR=1 FL=1
MAGELTDKQARLLADITQDLRRETALAFISGGYENQTEAYLAACKKLNKKPSRTPVSSASEILSYPNVKDFINSFKEEAAKATQTTAEYVLRRLREIDELDIIDIMMDDLSAFKPLSQWPKVWRISISGIDMKRVMQMDGDTPIETIIDKIKWPDKVKNLEMIGRHVTVKAWDKETEVSTTVHNIMPVPTAESSDDWEKAAQEQQAKLLGSSHG